MCGSAVARSSLRLRSLADRVAVAREQLIEGLAAKAVLAARCLDRFDQALARPAPNGSVGHVELAGHFTRRHPVIGAVLSARRTPLVHKTNRLFVENEWTPATQKTKNAVPMQGSLGSRFFGFIPFLRPNRFYCYCRARKSGRCVRPPSLTGSVSSVLRDGLDGERHLGLPEHDLVAMSQRCRSVRHETLRAVERRAVRALQVLDDEAAVPAHDKGMPTRHVVALVKRGEVDFRVDAVDR